MAIKVYSAPAYGVKLQPKFDHLYTPRQQSMRDVLRKFFEANGPVFPQPKGMPVEPTGFLYFVRASNGHIKIGATSNPEHRMRNLQAKNPHKLEYICLIEGAAQLEPYYHSSFEEYRLDGEWFEPAQLILDEIEELKAGKLDREP